MMALRKLTNFILFITVLAIGAYYMLSNTDPADGNPHVVKISTEMSVRDFMHVNQFKDGDREQGYEYLPLGFIDDISPFSFDDVWFQLTYSDGSNELTFPPGRSIFIAQVAGKIQHLRFKPFRQPRPLDEMNEYIGSLLQELQSKGWTPKTRLKYPVTKEHFNGHSRFILASLTSPSGKVMQLTLIDYALAPKQETFIIAPDTKSYPERSGVYLLDIYTQVSTRRPTYADVIYPRRIHDLGDPRQSVALRSWVEDPDWTPEKAGMVPVPDEERANQESSKWKMPPK